MRTNTGYYHFAEIKPNSCKSGISENFNDKGHIFAIFDALLKNRIW